MADSISNYTVQKGDTAWDLAAKFKNQLGPQMSRDERSKALLAQLGKDPKHLQPGDSINLTQPLGAKQTAQKKTNEATKPLAFKPDEAKPDKTFKTPLAQDIDQAVTAHNVDRMEQQTTELIKATDKTLASPQLKQAEAILTPDKAKPANTTDTIAGKNGADTHAKLVQAMGPNGNTPITQDVQISPQFSPQEMRNFAQADINYVDGKNAGKQAGAVEPKELEALGLPTAAIPTFMNNIDGVVSGQKDGVIDLNEKTALTAFADVMDGTIDGKYTAKNNDAMNVLLATDQTPTARNQLQDVVNQFKQYEPGLFQ